VKFRKSHKGLGKHLVSHENEEVTIMGSRGILQSLNVYGALAEMAAIGRATRTTKYFYHVSASPGKELAITNKQWEKVWSLYEKVQGLKKQNYIEVEHKKKGRVHRHRVYLRVDPVSGKSIQMSYSYIKNERIARELEHEFGHPIVTGRHTRSVIKQLRKEEGNEELINILGKSLSEERPVAQFNHPERQMKRRGMGVEDHQKSIFDSWCEHRKGKSFEEELKKRGLFLAMGKKAVMAVSFEGVDLPVLRSINLFQSKNNKKRIFKKELNEAIEEELISYDKIKDNRELLINNIRMDRFYKIKQEKVIVHGSGGEKTKASSHYLQKNIKSILTEGEKIFRSSDGEMCVKNNGEFIMKVSSNRVTLIGGDVIANQIERVMDIAKFNNWKSIDVKATRDEHKQYYLDVLSQFDPASITKQKSSANKASDEIELEDSYSSKIRDRHNLLTDEYFKNILSSDLYDEWEISRLPNGYIIFKNKNGTFIDKGNKISVAATQGNLQSCTKGALRLAKLKGWKTITVKGNADFKLKIYRQAHTFGIKIQKNSDYDDGLMKKVIVELKNKAQQVRNESKKAELPKEEMQPKKPRGPGM